MSDFYETSICSHTIDDLGYEAIAEMNETDLFNFMKSYYKLHETYKMNKSVKNLCDKNPFVGDKVNELCRFCMPEQWKKFMETDKKKCDELFKLSREAEKNGDSKSAQDFKNEAKKLLPFCNPNNIAYNQIQAIRCYTYTPEKDYKVRAKKTTYQEVLRTPRGYSQKYSSTNVYIVNSSITDSMRKLMNCFNCVSANQWDIGGGHSNGKMAQEEAIFYVLYTKPVYDTLIPVYGGKPIGENWAGFDGIGLGT